MIVPIVLGAGEGRRIGGPKALLRVGDRTCLEHVLAACRDGGTAPAVVVGRIAIDAALRALAGPFGGAVIANPDPSRGQSSSLRVGLAALPEIAEAFLIFPVDHPLVTGAEVAALVGEWRRGGARVVVPVHGGRRGHPVVVDVTLRSEILAQAGEAPARDVLRSHVAETRIVNVDDDAVVRDVDTPEDLAHCLEVLARRRPESR